VHRAGCNSCGSVIRGTRYKCMHPSCKDFDLCANCEALPIPPAAMPSLLFYALLLSFTLMSALAQSQSNNASSSSVSASPVVSTSFSVVVSQGSTITSAIPVTLTPAPTQSGNSTGNSTSSNTPSNSTSSSSTKTSPLPTAPTDVDGGGNGPGGAPSPGQSAPGGIYGPPDGYVSGVTRLQRNAVFVSLIGVVFGALLSLL
jgi:hypothetical protein